LDRSSSVAADYHSRSWLYKIADLNSPNVAKQSSPYVDLLDHRVHIHKRPVDSDESLRLVDERHVAATEERSGLGHDDGLRNKRVESAIDDDGTTSALSLGITCG
jgi:hypothetical protein